jgi:stage IV sporulation protein FB
MKFLMWMWSFRAFRLFRTDVRIHWSLPAYVLFYVLRSSDAGYAPFTFAMWILLPMLLLFASVVCHEFGHVFAARWLGQRTGAMILMPIGGLVMVAEGPTPRAEFIVAAAGPLVNLGLAVVACALYLASGGPFAAELLFPFGGHVLLGSLWMGGAYLHFALADFVQTNVALFLFNVLLVAYPLDGGRMLFSFLWKRRGRRRGLALACRIAQGLAIAMGAFALVTGRTGLVVIAFLVFFQATSTQRQLDGMLTGVVPPAPRYGRKAPSRPNFVRSWFSRRRRQRLAPRVVEVERHDDVDGTLPEDVMRQVRDAMERGRAKSGVEQDDPQGPDEPHR